MAEIESVITKAVEPVVLAFTYGGEFLNFKIKLELPSSGKNLIRIGSNEQTERAVERTDGRKGRVTKRRITDP